MSNLNALSVNSKIRIKTSAIVLVDLHFILWSTVEDSVIQREVLEGYV